MKRFLACSIAIIISLLPQVSFAHSKLVSSTPAADTTVTEKIDQLRLTYNTTIEQGSTLTLADETGKEIPVTIQVEGKDLIGSLTETLPNGAIQVNWKIIGEDGHLIEGDYQFTYQGTQPHTSEQTQPEVKPEPPKEQPITTKTSSNPLPWIVGGFLGVLFIVSIILFLWKGQKKS